MPDNDNPGDDQPRQLRTLDPIEAAQIAAGFFEGIQKDVFNLFFTYAKRANTVGPSVRTAVVLAGAGMVNSLVRNEALLAAGNLDPAQRQTPVESMAAAILVARFDFDPKSVSNIVEAWASALEAARTLVNEGGTN